MIVEFSLKDRYQSLETFCLKLSLYFWGRICFLREARFIFNVFQIIGLGLPTLPRLDQAYPYHQILDVLYKVTFSVALQLYMVDYLGTVPNQVTSTITDSNYLFT